MARGGVQPIDQRVERRRKGRRECRCRRLVRQLAMKGHGSALYAAGSEAAYLGHILCSIIAIIASWLLRLDLAAIGLRARHGAAPFLLMCIFSSFRRPRYPRAPLISMNERAARHEVTLGTAEGSQGEGETRKKSLT